MDIHAIEPRIEGLEEGISNATEKLGASIQETNSRSEVLESRMKSIEEVIPDVDELQNRKKRITELEEISASQGEDLLEHSQAIDELSAKLDAHLKGEDESEPEPEEEKPDAANNDTSKSDPEAADETATAPDFSELQAAVAEDVREYEQSIVNTAFYSEVCKKFNCWETVHLRDGTPAQSYPLRLPDAKYFVPSREMLDRILKETKVDEVQWVEDKEDCEDIARLFVQRCNDIGINSVGRVCAWSGGHAFCVAIVQDGTSVDFVFLEPQTDELLADSDLTDQGSMYNITNALIIIS